MARRIAILLLLLAVTSEATTRYVKTVGTGAKDGTSWANAGPPSGTAPLTWVNSVMAGGDTMYFGPGTYLGELRPPTNTNSNDRTCYASGDTTNTSGLSLTMYDPGIASLGSNFTRLQFEQSLLVAKSCTLTSATKLAPGTTWTNYSGSIYSASATLLPFRFWPTDRGYCGGQDTTILDGCADLASMTQGSFYHDITNGRVYVWCTDNSNPTTHTIWASASCTIDFDGLPNSKFVTFFGFDIRWNYYAGVHLAASSVDSIFVDHCRITKIFTQVASNAGIVGTQTIIQRSSCGGDYDCTYPYDGMYNRIRACYGAEVYEPGRDAGRCRLVTTYNQSHFVVESCLAVGLGGVDWKNHTSSGRSYGNCFKFNKVYHWKATAYEQLCGLNWDDSCYGNIFVGDPTNSDMKAVWQRYSPLGGNLSFGSRHFICNNVFYQCDVAVASGIYAAHDWEPNWNKYNIFYNTQSTGYNQQHHGESSSDRNEYWNDTTYISDSNLYYGCPASGGFYVNTTPGVAAVGVNYTFSQWQTRRSGTASGNVYHDLNSTYNTVNPNFVNASNGDFRRSGTLSEMDVTYGGKRWTSFGAEGASSAVGENPIFKTKASGSISVPNGAGGIQWR
jgi:hypothetical protein